MPEPWSIEKRSRFTAKMKKEADRAAARLGADYIVIIAFVRDGDHIHMQDAGNAPMPFKQLYEHLATAHAVVEESGGKDVAVS